MDATTATGDSLTADLELIEAFGGTAATAKVCEVRPQAVSQWRVHGIPKPRRMFLRLLLRQRQGVDMASQVPADVQS
jgi:hypothetical protein